MSPAYTATFAFAICTVVMVGYSRWIVDAVRVDKPSGRRQHSTPAPISGGLAIYVACILHGAVIALAIVGIASWMAGVPEYIMYWGLIISMLAYWFGINASWRAVAVECGVTATGSRAKAAR
jgi:UDP-N-acetylmuramyl pentapeptide phosphotransferase/UDP-N-acetylglucosamine-1-phosphate transferase